MVLINLIGQDSTSGTGRKRKRGFGVISESGSGKLEDERRGTGVTLEGYTDTPHSTEDKNPDYSYYLKQKDSERTQRRTPIWTGW